MTRYTPAQTDPARLAVHLPATWHAAQAQAARRGLWLDMTMDGVFHAYRGHTELYRGAWAGLRAWLGEQLELWERAA